MRRAFTLVEILVVIGIVATLAAILFPVFAQVRRKSYQTTCISNLRQIGMATLLYAQDYDDMLPWAGDPSDLNGVWDNRLEAALFADMKPQHEVLLPYLKNKTVWRCPADYGMPPPDYSWEGLTRESLRTDSTFFEKFGSSYYTHTALLLKGKRISSMDAYVPGGTFIVKGKEMGGPASIGYYFDIIGIWHGGDPTDVDTYRFNVAYLDGHARNVGSTEIDYLWALELR